MKKSLFLSIICLALISLTTPDAFARHRGGGFSLSVDKAAGALDYHALVIGISAYRSGIPSLKTSVNDARAVGEILVEKYGFPRQNLIELYDNQATRSNILRTMRELSILLDENDALVIYFAGHGTEDAATATGYWIPSDATANAYESYISNADIRTYLRAIKARHIFLVSDSCFSGTLLAQRAMPGEIDERFYARKAASRSRVVLTSGGKEPVMDSGCSGHSVFGYFFLKILRDDQRPYLTPTQIFVDIGPLVANNAPQTPQWGALREAMDEGGEIVFVNKRFSPTAKPDEAYPLTATAASPKPAAAENTQRKKSAKEKKMMPLFKNRRTLGWTLAGVGGGLMAGGGLSYLLAGQKNDDYKNTGDPDEAESARDLGRLYENIGMGAVGLGVVSAGAGIYFLTTPPGGPSANSNAAIVAGFSTTGDCHTAVFGWVW